MTCLLKYIRPPKGTKITTHCLNLRQDILWQRFIQVAQMGLVNSLTTIFISYDSSKVIRKQKCNQSRKLCSKSLYTYTLIKTMALNMENGDSGGVVYAHVPRFRLNTILQYNEQKGSQGFCLIWCGTKGVLAYFQKGSSRCWLWSPQRQGRDLKPQKALWPHQLTAPLTNMGSKLYLTGQQVAKQKLLGLFWHVDFQLYNASCL